tara:strand:- start:918 stop:1136 length:219 start_codon:yes stop_codon:yes gene_type:complete
VDFETIKYIQTKLLEPKKARLKDKVVIGVDNWDEYKYIIGQIRSIEDLQQDLTDLFKKQELHDDNNAEGAGD